MCWAQTNKEAKSTYDQLTIDLLCKSELVDQKGYNVSFTKDGNVSLYKLSPDCVTHEYILAQYMLCNFEHPHLQKYNDKRIQKFDSEHRVINEIQIFAGKHSYSHSEIRITFRPIQILVLLHFVTKKISLVFKNSYDTYRSNNFVKNNSLDARKRINEMNKDYKKEKSGQLLLIRLSFDLKK
jgi:hypothetical protein